MKWVYRQVKKRDKLKATSFKDSHLQIKYPRNKEKKYFQRRTKFTVKNELKNENKKGYQDPQ